MNIAFTRMKSAFLLLLICLSACAASAQTPPAKPVAPRYKVFAETVSPDGSFCIAWGEPLAPGANPASLRELPYNEKFEPEEVQDYVIPIARKQAVSAKPADAGRVPFALPGIKYFSGIDGHEANRGLSYAWAQDSASLVVLYDSEEKCLSALYVDIPSGQSLEIGPAMEIEARRLVRERYSAEQEAECKRTHFSRIALLPGAVLAADVAISAPQVDEKPPTEYTFRIRFRMEQRGGEVKLAVLQSKLLWPEDFKDDPYSIEKADLEREMQKVILGLAKKLDAKSAEALAQDQARWFKLRSGLANDWNKTGFTQHRIEQLRIRADE